MARRRNDDDDDDKPRRYRLAKKPVHPPNWEDDDEEDDCEDRRIRRSAVESRHGNDDDEEDYDDDEDTDEDEDDDREQQDLINLIDLIDRTRQSLDRHSTTLLRLLGRNVDLRSKWLGFVKSGGVTAADLCKYLDGKLRPRITRQRKHLRLVSNRKGVSLKLIKKSDDDVA